MKLIQISFILLIILSLNLVLGSNYPSEYSNIVDKRVGNNVLVTKYVVISEVKTVPSDPIVDIYQKRAIDNQIYLKYNSLESLKLGYKLYKEEPVDKKICTTVKGYHGPSYQGFKAAVYRTECKSTIPYTIRS